MNASKVDDRCQIELFREKGVQAKHVIWNGKGHDWSRFRAVIVRSTWDYYKDGNLESFLSVLQEIESAGAILVNPLRTIQWNCRKSYLNELPERIESLLLKRANLVDLSEIMSEKKWSECVIKPLVSAFGAHTYRFKADNEADAIGSCILSGISDWVLQPFIPEVVEEGEWSVVLLNGKCIHTVLKRPAAGNFLVHVINGGAFEVRRAPEWIIASAERIFASCGYQALIARIDLVRQGEEVKLMEIEAIEPLLYFDGSRELNLKVVEAIFSAMK